MWTRGPSSNIPTDTYFAQVVLLLHGNGADAGTVFTDSSSFARSVTRSGEITTSTAQSKWGGASIRGSSANQLSMTMGAEFAGRNWCVETWVRPEASFDYFGFFRVGTGGNMLARFYGTGDDSTYRLGFYVGGSEALVSLAAIPSGAWTHIAVTCAQGAGANNTIRLFVGGNLDASANSTNVNLDFTGATSFYIGPRDGVGFMGIYGNLDDYRVTMATRYTGSFAVPTQAFPDA